MKEFKCYCGEILIKDPTEYYYLCSSRDCKTFDYYIVNSVIHKVSLYSKYRNKIYCTKDWFDNNPARHKYVIRVVNQIDLNELSKFIDNLYLLE